MVIVAEMRQSCREWAPESYLIADLDGESAAIVILRLNWSIQAPRWH